MPLTLYLLRHGQTSFSREDAFCGAGLDPELTEDGLEMARAFADAHHTTSWKAVYSSPLKRTVATAQPLCERLGQEIEVREGLKEISYGAWEGKSKDEVSRDYSRDYRNWTLEPAWNPPTEGETAVQVAMRGMEVIHELNQKFDATSDDAKVLVVSHKATIRILICELMGIEVGQFRFRLGCPVGSVSVVKLTDQGPFLEVLNDRTHLSERLKNLKGT